MKTRLLTTVLFMAVSLGSFAQGRATLPKLKEATNRVLDFMEENDYQSLLEITYPTLFAEITEKDYLTELKNKDKGEGFTVIHKPVDRGLTYGPITQFNGGYSCVIYYNYNVSIALDKPLKKADEEAMKARITGLYENIKYEASDNSFIGKGRRPMVAVSDNSTGDFWNFVLYPDASYAKDLLPETAKAELHPELYPEGVPQEATGVAPVNGKQSGMSDKDKEAREKEAASKKGKN